jgi:hypothetical protein
VKRARFHDGAGECKAHGEATSTLDSAIGTFADGGRAMLISLRLAKRGHRSAGRRSSTGWWRHCAGSWSRPFGMGAPAGRGSAAPVAVRGHPAPDRRPAAKAAAAPGMRIVSDERRPSDR